VHRRRGHEPPVYKTVTPEQSGDAVGAGGAAESHSSASSGAESHSSASSGAESHSSGSSGGVGGHHPVVINKRVNYDDIFAVSLQYNRCG
jgi:hypothetical protein